MHLSGYDRLSVINILSRGTMIRMQRRGKLVTNSLRSKNLSEIRFVPPKQSQNLWRDKGVLVTLQVANLDKAWRYNRVPEGGGSDPETRFQYERAKQYIGVGQRVDLWATTVTKEDDEE